MREIGFAETWHLERIRKLSSYVVVALGAFFYFYEYLLRVAPSVMHTELMAHYHINHFQLANLIATYYYIYAPMQLPVGLIADRQGPFKILIIACLLCSVGGYMFVATDVLLVARTGRFLVGLGSSFAFVCVLKMAALYLPSRFAIISGVTMALGQLGATFGDISLSYLIGKMHWQTVNIYTAEIGLLLTTVMALAFFIHCRLHPNTLEQGESRGASESTFELADLYRMMRDYRVWVVCIMGLFMCLPVVVFAEFLSVDFLKHVYGFSASHAAFCNSMFFIGMAIGGPSVILFSQFIDSKFIPIRFGCAVASILLACFVTNVVPASKMPLFLLLLGFSTSVKVIVFPIMQKLSSIGSVATAIAFINMFVMLSGILFQPLSGYLLHVLALKDTLTASCYSLALSYVPLLLFSVVGLSFLISEP